MAWDTSSVAPHPPRGPGRPPILDKGQVAILVEVVKEDPSRSLRAVTRAAEHRLGVKLKPATVRNSLKRVGVESKSVKDLPAAAPSERKPSPYGYRKRHRREGSAKSYPSSVTDHEWLLVKHLFENHGPGRPPAIPRREMLDAVLYVLRSGCAWRMLPKDFPPWSGVYKTFRRWADDGLFEQMHDLLRSEWRRREGLENEPSKAIIDAQSVRTGEKGGPAATTRGRRSRGESVTS
jgi:transposase